MDGFGRMAYLLALISLVGVGRTGNVHLEHIDLRAILVNRFEDLNWFADCQRQIIFRYCG